MFGRRYPVRHGDPGPDVIPSDRASNRHKTDMSERPIIDHLTATKTTADPHERGFHPASLLLPAFVTALGGGLAIGVCIVEEANESREPVRVTVHSDPDQQGYGVSSDGETPLPAITDVKVDGDCVLMKKNESYLIWECTPR